MEFHDQSRGCTLYRATLPAGLAGLLTVREVHDFAWVFLDGKLTGVMNRRSNRSRIEVAERKEPTQLDLLVEAMGRVNFGPEVFDRKGIHAPVQLAGVELRDWQVFPLPLDEVELASLNYRASTTTQEPAFHRGRFELAKVGDTFLDMRTWGKGVAWVNGHCLDGSGTLDLPRQCIVPVRG